MDYTRQNQLIKHAFADIGLEIDTKDTAHMTLLHAKKMLIRCKQEIDDAKQIDVLLILHLIFPFGFQTDAVNLLGQIKYILKYTNRRIQLQGSLDSIRQYKNHINICLTTRAGHTFTNIHLPKSKPINNKCPKIGETIAVSCSSFLDRGEFIGHDKKNTYSKGQQVWWDNLQHARWERIANRMRRDIRDAVDILMTPCTYQKFHAVYTHTLGEIYGKVAVDDWLKDLGIYETQRPSYEYLG